MKRQRVSTEIFLNHEKVQVISTEQGMFIDFVKRVLIPWFHVAKRWGLPKDIAKKIAFEYITLDFQLHPVYQYLIKNRIREHNLIINTDHPRSFKREDLDVAMKLWKIAAYFDRNGVRRSGTKYGKVFVFVVYGDLEQSKDWLPEIGPNTKIIKF